MWQKVFSTILTQKNIRSDFNFFCSNNSDDLDEDCFESAKQSLDLQAPLQANAHLYCHASSLQLELEDNHIFDQKTQK